MNNRFQRWHKRRPPEGYIATEISNKVGKGWWLVKKGLLVISLLTSLTGEIIWCLSLAKGGSLFGIMGIVAGLILMAISADAISHFRVSIIKAVMIPTFAGLLLAITLIYATL